MNTRKQLESLDLEYAVDGVKNKLASRAQQKGMGTMASGHEILGILREEIGEYELAVQGCLSDTSKIEELKDIAVAAIFGIASIQSKGVDW